MVYMVPSEMRVKDWYYSIPNGALPKDKELGKCEIG